MKFFLVFGGILFFLTSFFTKNEKINTLVSKSVAEYKQEKYYASALLFDTLYHQYHFNSEDLYWNMANAWLYSLETDSALVYFEKLSHSKSLPMRSRAYNQIGLIQYLTGFPEEAELSFIESLKNDFLNPFSKFNLELLQKIHQINDSIPQGSSLVKTYNQKKVAQNKKLIKSKAYVQSQVSDEKKQLSQTKKPKAGSNNKNSENNKNEHSDDGEDITSLKSRKNYNSIIEQQEALRILEIMKQNEIQYLQQIKRKSKNTGGMDLPQY